jgi:uncharacterized protein (UPF0264 family)
VELLVSVRSAGEIEAALAGGADIIDAKEPGRGSLGAVTSEVLGEIVHRVPGHVSMSVALGDHEDPELVVATVKSLPLAPRPAPLYLKFGFAGIRSEARIEQLIATAVAACAESAAAPRVIAVAYADATRAATVSPHNLQDLAARAGAAGILLDTFGKDGMGLLRWVGQEDLKRWTGEARGKGLITGLAGGLRLDDLDAVSAAWPDVLGVRGAVCLGGREGWVDLPKVRAMRRRLNALSGSVQGQRLTTVQAGSRNA